MSEKANGILPRVLVTGANGFVGAELCAYLTQSGYRVLPAVRRARTDSDLVVGEIDESTVWSRALECVDVVVHLAARVHVMDGRSPEEEFERINVRGSAHLAREAALAGVKRLVFVSSIKVNGEATHGKPFDESDVPHPQDAYGRSKLAAERILEQIAAETGLELVIVRPPMVIGPGAKGNLPLLLHGLLRGVPLPFASIKNRRSFIGVHNLACLLELCAVKAVARGEVFVAADEPALSTPALINCLASGLRRKPRMWRAPVSALRIFAALVGKRAQIARLIGDLEIDASKARNLLGWRSIEPLDKLLGSTARHYLESKRGL